MLGKIKITYFKNYLYTSIIFLLVISAGGMHFAIARLPLTFALLFLFPSYIFIFHQTFKFTKLIKAIIVLCIFIVILVVNYVCAIQGQRLNTYLYMALTIIIAFFANLSIQNNNFSKSFLATLYLIEIHAVLSFVFSIFFEEFLQSFFLHGDNLYQTFHYIFFYRIETNQVTFYGLNFIRNCGLFWEPGILQIFLNLLLYIQLFEQRTSLVKILITILLIITTYSTTGYIIMLLLLAYKYKSVTSIKNFPYLFLIAIPIIMLFYPIISFHIGNKAFGENVMSTYVRVFDAIQSIIIIGDYPLTGIGITWEVYEKLQLSYKNVFGIVMIDATGNTNSILSTIVLLGIPTGLLFILALYRQELIAKKNKIIIFIVLFISLSSEPLLLRPFFMFLIFNGIVKIISFPKPTPLRQKT